MVEEVLHDAESISADKLTASLLDSGNTELVTTFSSWRSMHPHVAVEATLNNIGYALARDGRIEDAISIFDLNAKEYPKAWNVWDSLGEGYEMSGDHSKALKYYKRSVEINPENQHGIDKIKELTK